MTRLVCPACGGVAPTPIGRGHHGSWVGSPPLSAAFSRPCRTRPVPPSPPPRWRGRCGGSGGGTRGLGEGAAAVAMVTTARRRRARKGAVDGRVVNGGRWTRQTGAFHGGGLLSLGSFLALVLVLAFLMFCHLRHILREQRQDEHFSWGTNEFNLCLRLFGGVCPPKR